MNNHSCIDSHSYLQVLCSQKPQHIYLAMHLVSKLMPINMSADPTISTSSTDAIYIYLFCRDCHKICIHLTLYAAPKQILYPPLVNFQIPHLPHKSLVLLIMIRITLRSAGLHLQKRTEHLLINTLWNTERKTKEISKKYVAVCMDRLKGNRTTILIFKEVIYSLFGLKGLKKMSLIDLLN